MKGNTFLVIQIKDRYFSSFGKNNRIQTAWSLAGAKTYLEDGAELRKDLLVIRAKHKSATVMRGEVSLKSHVFNCKYCGAEFYYNSDKCVHCYLSDIEKGIEKCPF
ncbi:hypothetical protein CGT94_05130 [Vibrio metoecus]|uniref:hypothetical protein n=1 Tax=Vibrio metoecus TaxID=1481663 RepID=UPI0006D7D6CB|nr:hypothetical protein [Vibrio metoecus]KQB07349.1 hypothetical protein XV93_03565 [Vibrio metoecus]PAR50979.1 hypothetical protein CGT94_05130 [Vibrio metoecus]